MEEHTHGCIYTQNRIQKDTHKEGYIHGRVYTEEYKYGGTYKRERHIYKGALI